MSAMSETTKQRAALLAAVGVGDVAKVRSLLDAGLNPAATYKTKTAFHEALTSGEEAMVRPFIEAFERDRLLNRDHLSAIAGRVFEDDRFSSSLAGALVSYVNAGLSGERARRQWDVRLAHGMPDFFDRFIAQEPSRKEEPRHDEVLAGKVALAINDGWRPGEAWRDGWLPHHEYLNKGWIEAALACVAGGANPDEPMRRFGFESPDTFVHAWPAFQARLRAQRADDAPMNFSSTTRTRQRA